MVATQSKNTSIEHARASLTLFKEFCLSYQPGDGFSGFGVFDKYVPLFKCLFQPSDLSSLVFASITP